MPYLRPLALAATAALAACGMNPLQEQKGPMSFFVTSVGSGKGGDLGGLAGADAHCQKLAAAAGASKKNWRAYLSVPPTFASAGNPAVPAINARDRIGKGPWFNAKGQMIARDLTHLHTDANINKETALDERGSTVNGVGDQPVQHDMLTGSRSEGTAFGPHLDTTCKAWTSSGEGSAIVGHHDRKGPMPGEVWATSWNFSHPSRGCSQEALVATGGAGKFYCFAAD